MANFSYQHINEVYIDDEAIIEYCKDNFSPDEVFPESELEDWAERNGYVKEGE